VFIRKLLNTLISDPLKILNHISEYLYKILISTKSNIHIAGEITLIGIPMIDIRDGSKLEIGKNVVLRSRNKGCHINLHSPVKLFGDREGSIIKIGDNSRINGTCIHAYESVTIGKNCLVAANCQIMDGNGHDLSFPDVENRVKSIGSAKPIVLEDSVWIGANSIILPGVRIGRGSVISANSVVVRDIPAMVIAGGNPARIKKYTAKK